jgi:transposase-like protein
MSNNTWLRKYAAENAYSRSEIARRCCVNQSTVDRWMQPRTRQGERNPQFRKCPDMAIKLLLCLNEIERLRHKVPENIENIGKTT